MKTLLLSVLLISNSAFAAFVQSAKLDRSLQNLLVTVSYSGGCAEHKFELSGISCSRSMPAKCVTEIKDITEVPDYCEAFITKTVKFNLEQHGINGNVGGLTIYGSPMMIDGEFRPTSAHVVFPNF